MTAIVIMPMDDKFVIATDGAVCSPEDGSLLGLLSKVVLIPEWSCAFAARGFAGISQDLYRHVGWRRNFDDLLTVVGPVSQDLHARHKESHKADCHWSMVIMGFSTIRQRPEMYFLRSREFKMPNVGGETQETIHPYCLHETWSLYAAPMPPQNVREQFGIDLGEATEADPVELTCKLVAAARHTPDNEFSALNAPMIGGFIQSTIVSRDAVTSSIVHRWPDKIGEKIDPACDEPLPGHLTANRHVE